MIVGVEGLGAVGMRAVRELVGTPEVDRVLIRSRRKGRIAAAREAFGDQVAEWTDSTAAGSTPSTVVLAGSPGTHATTARRHLEAGRHVVSTTDDPDDVRQLLELEDAAAVGGAGLTVGAGFSPGLSCLLARHAAAALVEVDMIRVSMAGYGGPECEKRRAEARNGIEPAWRDGRWTSAESNVAGLVWFPDPIGALDAVGGTLIEPLLLHRALPAVPTIDATLVVPGPTGRLQALAARRPTAPRRGQATEPLGAVRVEASGRGADGTDAMIVYAVVDRPAVAAGVVAALAAVRPGASVPGVRALAEADDVLPLLVELARRGVKAETYEPAV